ncbi:hypothetical protein Tco_0015627 [Tanacetum coccineum]
MLTSDSSDDNKGVSSEGPSITSIPKEGLSIARQSKEPIPKELLKWYGYDTVEDYLPIAKKPIPKVIFKSPIPIKGSDDHDLLVNSDNENDDMLGYESEKYSDDKDVDGTNHAEDADETNHSDLKLVKRGITRLYKFRREYGKPGGIKIKVTFDALNRVSGLHRALFFSFLADLVRENIGLKILSWKKVDKESRDKLCDEIMRYFDVDLTVRKLVMHRLGKLLRNFRMKLREKYILPNLNTPSKLNELPAKYSAIVKAEEWVEFVNYTTTDAYKIENKEIEADEEPPCGIIWLKERVNKDKEFTDDEIRSVRDKLKEADDKIKEGTLNLDDGTDAMTDQSGRLLLSSKIMILQEGCISDKRYFHLPRSRQATDERIELLQTQLDNERRERQQKDVLVKKLSNEITETKGMLSQLMNQLAAQGVQLNLSSQLQVASDVTPMGAYEVDGTQSSEPVKIVGPKKTPKSRRNGSQDSQSQGNVSPTQELPTASKCKLWHLKKSNIVALATVYKSTGKQMLHNQALLNDCYKVSIDSSLVDATCIPDVGNNGLKTVKDGVGGFFAWPKNQVVLDEEVTPPTTIQKISDYNSTPKLQSKCKSYVSRETMQRQARTGKSLPGNIVRALGGRGKRKDTISPKEVVFTKIDESPSETAPVICSDSESEYDNQEPLPPLPKLLGAEPTGTSIDVISLADLTLTIDVPKKTKQATNKVSSVNVTKKKTRTKSPVVPDPCLDKKAASTTEQLLLTLMEERPLGKFNAKADDGFFLGYSLVAKAFKGVMKSTSMKTDPFLMMNSLYQEAKYLKAQAKMITFLMFLHMIPFPQTTSPSLIMSLPLLRTSTLLMNRLSSTIADDHPVHNEHDNFKSADNLEPTEVQDSIINKPISKAEPSPIIISPPVDVFINPPIPQDRWSIEKHIDLVNIIGEPLAGVTAVGNRYLNNLILH